MKKILSLIGIVLAQQTSQATVLFTNNFDAYANGTTSITDMLFDPARYQVATDTTFGTDKVLQTSDTQNNVAGVFSSTSLATGNYIALHVNYRWTAAPTVDPQGNFIRMGLFNNGGTAPSTHTDTNFDDEHGYLADATYYASQFGYAVREEDSTNTAFNEILLDEYSTNDMVQLGSDTTKSADNGTDFDVFSLRIGNTGSDMQLDLFFEDSNFAGAPVLSVTDSLDTVSTFDSFYVRAAGSFSANFQIEKITVETGVIPEVRAYGLIVGLCALGVISRRRVKREI
jgi:hypothetical protein